MLTFGAAASFVIVVTVAVGAVYLMVKVSLSNTENLSRIPVRSNGAVNREAVHRSYDSRNCDM